MTTKHDVAFDRLLRSWNHHQDLREHGAPIAELARSRAELDNCRFTAVRSIRQAA